MAIDSMFQPTCKSRKEFVEHCKKTVATARQFYGNKMIYEYVKDNNGQRIGVTLAVKDDKFIRLGVSKCNSFRYDKFDPYVGVYYALKATVPVIGATEVAANTATRVRSGTANDVNNWIDGAFTLKGVSLPFSVRPEVVDMFLRAQRYFGFVKKEDGESSKTPEVATV